MTWCMHGGSLETGWLGRAAVAAELALLRVEVSGLSPREPVYCVAPRGRAVFGLWCAVLIHGEQP